jgi:hypothetical protein
VGGGSSRFTLFFERFAVQVLEACPAARAGRVAGISWDEADGIKQRAVRRGLARRQISGWNTSAWTRRPLGVAMTT